MVESRKMSRALNWLRLGMWLNHGKGVVEVREPSHLVDFRDVSESGGVTWPECVAGCGGVT